MTEDHPNARRIDRVLDPAFVAGIADLPLDDLRARRDDALSEREYLSLLRRLLQGRAEILKAEAEGRAAGEVVPLVDRLTSILAADDHSASRGEAVRVTVPEDEMLMARRRVERLAADAGISDPTTLDDAALAAAIDALVTEEADVSASRRRVLDVVDALQDELKRRYKDDPSLALT
ncbi:MAG TPA: aerial mycelium formation protein [Actinomycetota bacterium]|nr:aerial mycelium formation protein [Actinomycetota bacterium]